MMRKNNPGFLTLGSAMVLFALGVETAGAVTVETLHLSVVTEPGTTLYLPKADFWNPAPSSGVTITVPPTLGSYDGTVYTPSNDFWQIGVDHFTVYHPDTGRAVEVVLSLPESRASQDSLPVDPNNPDAFAPSWSGISPNFQPIDGRLWTNNGGIRFDYTGNFSEFMGTNGAGGTNTGLKVPPPDGVATPDITAIATLMRLGDVARVEIKESATGNPSTVYSVRGVVVDSFGERSTGWLPFDATLHGRLNVWLSRSVVGKEPNLEAFPHYSLRLQFKLDSGPVVFLSELHGVNIAVLNPDMEIGIINPTTQFKNRFAFENSNAWYLTSYDLPSHAFDNFDKGSLDVGWTADPSVQIVSGNTSFVARTNFASQPAASRVKNLGPNSTTDARIRFTADLSNIAWSNANSMVLASGTSTTNEANIPSIEGVRSFDVVVQHLSGGYWIWARTWNAAGTLVKTPNLAFNPAVPQEISVHWTKSSSPTSADGKLVLSVNGVSSTAPGFTSTASSSFQGGLIGPTAINLTSPINWIDYDRILIVYPD